MLVKSCNAVDPDLCDMRQWLYYGSREVGVFLPKIPLVEKNVVISALCKLQITKTLPLFKQRGVVSTILKFRT